MKNIILTNCHIIDPKNNRDQEKSTICINDGKIHLGETLPSSAAESTTIDLGGKWVVPGLIDMHVHLREPGQEFKEDIASGTRAAATGGFTAVACMPNTSPVNDCASVTRYIVEQAKTASARVYPVGAISCASNGESLAQYGEMKEAGAVALSDDGLPVLDSQLMRRALEYSSSFGMRVISHSEEFALSRNGCMNEGALSTRLGLKGIPNAAESIMVYREIALAELTGIPIHIAHVSTRQSIDLIARAKERGVPVTAETAPHYFTLTEQAVDGYNTNAKMNPPLRSEEDRDAIRAALTNGTLDAIATDHAPHTILDKEVEFATAANGIIGLETALPLSLALVREGIISVSRMIELMSVNPANILGVPGGSLHDGADADITVIDPDYIFTYSRESIVSKAFNTPFLDWDLTGRAVMTIKSGTITFDLLTNQA